MHYVLLALSASCAVHVLTIILYVLTKSKTMFYAFLATAFSNMALGMTATVIAFRNPQTVKSLNFGMLFWHLSGLLMIFLLCVKLYIAARIIIRSRDQSTYHLNYFGKKVYNERLVTKSEMNIFLLIIPFFLISGAYFVSKLLAR